LCKEVNGTAPSLSVSIPLFCIHLSESHVEDEEWGADDRNRTKPQNPSNDFDEKEQGRTLDSFLEPILQFDETNQ
jgi:hypothetical protein